MPLINYSQYLTYPDGSPAADMPWPVQLLGGNVLVPLFSDKAGTIPLTNPAMSDVDGLVTFYAAPGAFYTEIAGNVFHYFVDTTETDDAWPGTFIHTQVSASVTWTVAHHFGVEPAVSLVVDGVSVEAEVQHVNDETTVITFSQATSGLAFLRR